MIGFLIAITVLYVTTFMAGYNIGRLRELNSMSKHLSTLNALLDKLIEEAKKGEK